MRRTNTVYPSHLSVDGKLREAPQAKYFVASLNVNGNFLSSHRSTRTIAPVIVFSSHRRNSVQATAWSSEEAEKTGQKEERQWPGNRERCCLWRHIDGHGLPLTLPLFVPHGSPRKRLYRSNCCRGGTRGVIYFLDALGFLSYLWRHCIQPCTLVFVEYTPCPSARSRISSSPSRHLQQARRKTRVIILRHRQFSFVGVGRGGWGEREQQIELRIQRERKPGRQRKQLSWPRSHAIFGR